MLDADYVCPAVLVLCHLVVRCAKVARPAPNVEYPGPRHQLVLEPLETPSVEVRGRNHHVCRDGLSSISVGSRGWHPWCHKVHPIHGAHGVGHALSDDDLPIN